MEKIKLEKDESVELLSLFQNLDGMKQQLVLGVATGLVLAQDRSINKETVSE